MRKYLAIIGITTLALLTAFGAATGDPCDVTATGSSIISHNMSISYCELCSYGYVTVIISNPYDEDTAMTGMTLVENLGNSGLTFDPSAPDAIEVNGTTQGPGAAPAITGTNGRILTWTSTQITELGALAANTFPSTPSTLTIRFAVTRSSALSDEGLNAVSDLNRRIRARLDYTVRDTGSTPGVCPGSWPDTDYTPWETLDLHEPDPDAVKGGRNVDAAQGTYTPTAYGNDHDDIIWRIRVNNNGDADLQDLGLDDVMASGNIDINYICPSEAAAEQIAITNDGAGPSTLGCRTVSNNRVLNFDVDDPFGEPPTGFVDVSQGDYTDIFLVGKIPTAAPGIGACSISRTNTVSNIRWGCESDGPDNPGGITATNGGSPLSPATATLSTQSDNDLDITVQITGVSASQPAGTKGRVRVTITNLTGGTVKGVDTNIDGIDIDGIRLRDILPTQYVVDRTFTPRVVMDPEYGNYPGMIDNINWLNDAGAGNELSNTAPVFELTSEGCSVGPCTATAPAGYPGQRDMLRHGDELEITFGIILVRTLSYDKQADLDVREEAPGIAASDTDPDNRITNMTNSLYVDFEDFCDPGTVKHPVAYPITANNYESFPEDLDIDISGSVLDFILTDQTTQLLPLTVELTNRGGHDAEDYTVFVAFGQTMQVANYPSSVCTSPPNNRPPLMEWQIPANIPTGATVFECSGAAIGPGATRDFDFQVRKSTVPADVTADDLTFRADVTGEITLSDGTLLTFPPITRRNDFSPPTDVFDRANNYSLDGIRARVIGFNLLKTQEGNCTENIAQAGSPPYDDEVQIGEECTYQVKAGGWFGFQTPGYTLIAVRDVRINDELPDGQGYVYSTDPRDESTHTGDVPPGQINVNTLVFERVGGPSPPPPAATGDLEEGFLYWRFNETNQITVIEQWFQVNLDTRVLNDPVDPDPIVPSTEPNKHADISTNVLTSEFVAVFDDGSSQIEHTLDESTVGYPRLDDRHFDLTITEPYLTVEKQVCNDSLHDCSPTSTSWVDLANDGDAYNDYIYRIIVTNEPASGGVTRAPAYNVTVTDTLDVSDLAEVLAFGSDGLDNDGDSAVDEPGAGNEGSVSDNTVNNSTPAVITFSHTHSAALERIDAGNSVTLYYRVDFDDDAAPMQEFSNSAYATYDSLEGEFGNQRSDLQRANSDIAGARVYTSPTDTAVVQIIPVLTLPKEIVAMSNTSGAYINSGNPPYQGVSIGEEIQYRLTTQLPVARLKSFVISDTLPEGLSCSEVPAIDLSAGIYAAAGFDPGGPPQSTTCSGRNVAWDFGDQEIHVGNAGVNRYDFIIDFIARVDNTAGNNAGDNLVNGAPTTSATVSYIDEDDNPEVINFGQVGLQVREPDITLTKTFVGAPTPDAADVLTVEVTASNDNGATSAIAYNLMVMDDLTGGSGLTYVGNVGGSNPPDNINTTVTNRPIFSWNALSIDPGDSISFTFEVRVDNNVQPQETLDNTIQAAWTSLPGDTTALNSGFTIGTDGAADGMRIGTLPNNPGDTINDYETTATAAVNVPAVTVTKTDLDTVVVPTIGAHKRFQLDIALPEGETHALLVTDTLDRTGLSYILENEAGLLDITYSFQGITSINGAVAPFGEGDWIAFPADETSGSAIWNFGNVVTQTENDTNTSDVSPLIRITYTVRIANDADTDAGDTLRNSVEVNYAHGDDSNITVSQTASTNPVTVVEPLVSLAKSVVKLTNVGNPLVGGDRLQYTLTLTAAGGSNNSNAFDLRIDDTLGQHLSYVPGSVSVSPPGNTIVDPDEIPSGSDTILRWIPLPASPDSNIDIVAGTAVTITYEVLVGGGVLPNQRLTNSATAQWTSLDGPSSYERDGSAAPWEPAPGAAYNDYFTGPQTTALVVGDNNTSAKTRLSDTYGAGDEVRIGDIVEYELRLGIQEGSLKSVVVVDNLPVGLQFDGIVSVNGDGTPDYEEVANFTYDPNPIPASAFVATVDAFGITTLTCTLGNITNNPDGDPTNDFFIIRYRARVLNLVHPHVNNIPLANSMAMQYLNADDDPVSTISVTETINVRQPDLSVAKISSPPDGSVLASSQTVTYTIDITNNGTAPAYDTVLQDTIPMGMLSSGITMVSIEMPPGTPLPGPHLAPVYDALTGIARWEFDTGTADQYTIPATQTMRIVYEVQTDAGLGPGMTLANLAQVQLYYSFDDDDPPSGDPLRVDEREIYGPSNTAISTLTTAGAVNLEKANPATSTVTIGEPFTYEITVPATAQPTALHDVHILDDLSASSADLRLIRITKIAGSQPWTPVNIGTASNLVIEGTDGGIDIPANETITIGITVILEDTAGNNRDDLFNNTARYTYNRFNGIPTSRTDGGSDTTADLTIVEPDQLTMEKSGPATVSLGTPGAYTLNVHNTGNGTAWNPTITDLLPNDATGGTCDAGPSNIVAGIYLADATTLVTALVENTDYNITFNGDPTCSWTLQMLSASDGIPADHRLIVTYETALDSDTQNGVSLTNYAGATQWYSYDPEEADAAPRIYTRTITDGTVTLLDHQDAHTTNTETPILEFYKRVENLTSGQIPGRNASPGDILRYTIQVTNGGPVGLADLSISDDLDGLNATPLFEAGTLNLISAPVGAGVIGTDSLGGVNGTGLVQVDNITIGAQGDPNEAVEVVFDITLIPVIDSGTVAFNQAGLSFLGFAPLLSDDPNITGTPDPTETLIGSAPQFQVRKTSTYMTGDPAVLMAGETLRYTITIKNVGTENAVNASLRDFTPANTTYVPDSTTLNGNAVADPSPGVNPLHGGILINAPEDTTPGYMRADDDPGADNTVTVIFDVVVDADAMNGLVIENQGFVGSDGVGSGAQPEQPSDDPDTSIPDDPTRDVVGNLPLLYAHKTVALSVDNNSNGFVDPGDGLLYTVNISNSSAIDATNVVLTDAVPANTAYVANSIRLNGGALAPDGGVSPLIAGLMVQSSDNPGAGIVSAGESAVITFAVTVNAGVPTGTIISNQGTVTSTELVPLLTDADGLPANGYQPTIIVVGDAQLLTISKAVSVVGGGTALAGGQLEYMVRVTNAGSVAATNLVITDDLSPPLGTQVTYVTGSGTLDGALAGVTYAGNILTANFASIYGDLAAGSSCVLRFRVQINATIAIGTTITNTGVVTWNSSPSQTDSASVSIDVGGMPGSGILNGNVWHDVNLDTVLDGGEPTLSGWGVTLYRNGTQVAAATTDASGTYQFSGLLPNNGTSDRFELRFTALGAGANAAAMGYADSIFTDTPHRISDIVVASGDNLQNLNLPIQPNGTVYDSVIRVPIAGATLTLRNAATGNAVSDQCFADPNQQNQVTADEGYYKFDMNFNHGSCPAGGSYLIEVTPPATGYMSAPSLIIPPESDATTAAFSIPACPGSAADAVPATPGHCEAVTHMAVPPVSVPPRTAGTSYYLHLMLDGSMPGQSQIYNNPIPIDPEMEGFTAISKTVAKLNVSRSALVPYTITVTNVVGAPLYDITIIDRFPAGFKYVEGSARLNGTASEPRVSGRELYWENLELQVNEKHVIKLLLVVGSGVSEGEYVNRAQVSNSAIGGTISGEATATVRVVPDPDFDCSDVIGKVFDDTNLNSQQDAGELGLAGVRVVTVRGLIATTDEHGRFHITCAAVPDEDRGSNFILKLDERSLPSGYRLTTENPRVQRATRGKMLRYNFGATIHSVVRIDIADGVFELDTTELRIQWSDKIGELINELRKAPSVLRLSYLGDIESKGLVKRRLKALKHKIIEKWESSDGGYPLTIETEIFWRRGAPFNKRR